MIYTYWRNLFILEQVKQIKLFVLKKKPKPHKTTPPPPKIKTPSKNLLKECEFSVALAKQKSL